MDDDAPRRRNGLPWSESGGSHVMAQAAQLRRSWKHAEGGDASLTSSAAPSILRGTPALDVKALRGIVPVRSESPVRSRGEGRDGLAETLAEFLTPRGRRQPSRKGVAVATVLSLLPQPTAPRSPSRLLLSSPLTHEGSRAVVRFGAGDHRRPDTHHELSSAPTLPALVPSAVRHAEDPRRVSSVRSVKHPYVSLEEIVAERRQADAERTDTFTSLHAPSPVALTDKARAVLRRMADEREARIACLTLQAATGSRRTKAGAHRTGAPRVAADPFAPASCCMVFSSEEQALLSLLFEPAGHPRPSSSSPAMTDTSLLE